MEYGFLLMGPWEGHELRKPDELPPNEVPPEREPPPDDLEDEWLEECDECDECPPECEPPPDE